MYDFRGAMIPDIPEKGGDDKSYVDRSFAEDFTASLPPLLGYKLSANGRLTLRFIVNNLGVALDYLFEYSDCERDKEGCEDRE